MAETPFNDSINELRQCQEDMKKKAAEAPDVKEGKCTAEEELREPAYLLYNQIAESSIRILQLPEVVKTFSALSDKLGDDLAKSFVELLAMTMTQSAHQAVLFYDDLLKCELTKQFDNVGEHLNDTRAIVEGHTGALSVFKTQLNEIQTKLKKDAFAKANGISPTE